ESDLRAPRARASTPARRGSARPARPARLDCSSGFLRPRKLRLDLFRDLGKLGEDLDRPVGVLGRLELLASPLQPLEQRFRALQALFRAHLTSSRRSENVDVDTYLVQRPRRACRRNLLGGIASDASCNLPFARDASKDPIHETPRVLRCITL